MKKLIWIFGIIFLFFINDAFAQDEELSPYFKVTEFKGSMKDAGKENKIKVFEQIFPGKEIAVFGVGLWGKEEGEPASLPVIGESHIANLLYEIILQGKEATMLHGKYRIAIYWPEMTMGTFMKISGTPGDIEDMLEVICGAED